MKYEIPEANLKTLQTRITRLNAKLVRVGTDTVTCQVTGHRDIPSEKDATRMVRIIELEVQGTAPTHNGWGFVATLVHTSEGNIVRSAPGFQVPADYREAAPKCDHCKINRARRDTYILQHEDGRTVQVGSSCLEEFLGVKPGKLTKAAELFLSAYAVCEAAQRREWLGGSNVINTYRLDLETFLKSVAAVVLKDGYYVTRKVASEQNTPSTSDTASVVMNGGFTVEKYPVTPEAEKLAADARAWVLSTYSNDMLDPTDMSDEEAMAMVLSSLRGVNRSLSDFEHNLLSCARAEAIEPRLCGIAAYIIEAFRRSQPKKTTQLATAGLDRIFQLFNSATKALKRPVIRLATSNGHYLSVSLAGATSRNAGSIYVKGERGTDAYYGKVTPEGKFFPVAACPSTVEGQLMAFAADPEGVASKYGKLTGSCCFCGRNLTDERSTEVGYGKVCSTHFGLKYPTYSELEKATADTVAA